MTAFRKSARGTSILNGYYKGSLVTMLKTRMSVTFFACQRSLTGFCARVVYPEHTWLPWRFRNVPHGFWNSRTNILKYFSWLEQQLHIRDPLTDWPAVATQTMLITSFGAAALLNKYGGLKNLLQYVSL